MGQLPDNSEARYKLEDEIKKLEDISIGVSRPTVGSVKLDTLEYAPPTDAELELRAQNSLESYKRDGENAIREQSANSEKTLSSTRDGYVAARQSGLDELEQSYKTASDNIDSDVIKRGIARSSIAANAKSELESARAESAAAVMIEYDKKIADIDAEIASVSDKLKKALDDFNLAYAVKLDEKLNSLKSSRDEKVAEVTKYNNEIKAKQASLDRDKQKTESDLYSEALSQKIKASSLNNLSPDERNEVYKSIYAKMDGYLSTLSQQQAKLEIRNHTLYRDHLSDYFYYKLYDKYGR